MFSFVNFWKNINIFSKSENFGKRKSKMWSWHNFSITSFSCPTYAWEPKLGGGGITIFFSCGFILILINIFSPTGGNVCMKWITLLFILPTMVAFDGRFFRFFLLIPTQFGMKKTKKTFSVHLLDWSTHTHTHLLNC